MSQLSFDDLLAEDRFYSVSELTKQLRFLLESSFSSIWIQGEMSNFTRHASGHMYFSLKDERAQISCVMWRTNNLNLFFTPQDGLRVTINADVTIFEKRGVYQLNVLQLLPAGKGDLQLAFEQLKKRLNAEGLFQEERKRPLPRYPERIGIVTSPSGAALRDIVTVLTRRLPSVQIVLNPVRVQGEGAAFEIAQAIDEFNEYGEVDLLIVGRGGGSLEDLWAFNEEIVARAVFRSKIPVISAVGHEVDFSICDFVADLRAPTPSAAAEMAVRSQEELRNSLQQRLAAATNALVTKIETGRERIRTLQSSYAFRQPLDLIRQLSQQVDENRRLLKTFMDYNLRMNSEKLTSLSQRLSLLEHDNVLKRGYSICSRLDDGAIIRDASQLQVNDQVKMVFSKGKTIGTVDEVIK